MFEWCGWYKPQMPVWLYPEQLVENGFPVDPAYVPFISTRNLNPNESVEEYYNRCASLTKHVLRKHATEGVCSSCCGVVVVVTVAAVVVIVVVVVVIVIVVIVIVVVVTVVVIVIVVMIVELIVIVVCAVVI